MVKVDGMSDSRTIFYEDKDGNLWIGIDHKGLYLKKSITKPFHSITKEQGLSNNIVKSIYFDKAANLWIGTDGGGLNMFSKDLKKLAVFQHDPNDKKSISDNAIITLLEDKNNNLWIGSYLGGLSVFDKNTATFTNYLNDSTREGSNYNYFTSIIDDRNEGIWIGIMGMGIYNFDLNTRRFTGHQKALINGKWQDLPLYINILFLDNENNLWIGSYNGLYLWNAKKGVLKSFTKSNKLLKSDEIFDIMQDRIGNIWVGTSSGLYKITDSKITRYAEQDGLASNTMHSILEDEHHNLWIGTENGLSKFDPVKKQFINYFTRDGLPSNEFRYSSRFKREDGMLYFGTASGLVYFHPDSIKESERSPKLLLSRLKLFNKDVPVGKTENKYTILDKPLDDADNLPSNLPPSILMSLKKSNMRT
jgi:ligand-binding sensor domain-containing protein